MSMPAETSAMLFCHFAPEEVLGITANDELEELARSHPDIAAKLLIRLWLRAEP